MSNETEMELLKARESESEYRSRLSYLVGYMEAQLTSMRDCILEEHYSKLFPKIEDALKLLKEKYNAVEFYQKSPHDKEVAECQNTK